ncbi:MAG: hypothetical protein L0228_20670 [Planctomycetes bacterium]|nr:hypothetical protein [Planctomycetota bacterium]
MSASRSTSRPWLVFQRHPAVALRQERWGGLAFHRDLGDLMELDEQGFEVLASLARATDLRELRFAIGRAECPPRLPELAHFVGDLVQRGFVQRIAWAESRPAYRSFGQLTKVQCTEQQFRGDSRDLSAPLVAHWAVTYRCNLACPFCYSESGPHREREPAAHVRCRLVARLA